MKVQLLLESRGYGKIAEGVIVLISYLVKYTLLYIYSCSVRMFCTNRSINQSVNFNLVISTSFTYESPFEDTWIVVKSCRVRENRCTISIAWWLTRFFPFDKSYIFCCCCISCCCCYCCLVFVPFPIPILIEITKLNYQIKKIILLFFEVNKELLTVSLNKPTRYQSLPAFTISWMFSHNASVEPRAKVAFFAEHADFAVEYVLLIVLGLG